MFISYTQCFVLHIEQSSVTCLLNYIEKNRGGGGGHQRCQEIPKHD